MGSWSRWLVSLGGLRGEMKGDICPFCFPTAVLDTKGARTLTCPSCETRFIRKDNELEPIIPPMPQDATPQRRTCIPLDQGKLSLTDPLLCKTCQHHQTILLQLLSAGESRAISFLDKPEADSEAAEEEEQQYLQKYRKDLERRYPLCATCRTRVQDRLRIVEYKVRSRRLATRSRADQVRGVQRERSVAYLGRLVFVADATVQAIISAAFLWQLTDMRQFCLSRGMYLVGKAGTLLDQHFTWNVIVIPMAMAAIVTDMRNVLRTGWTLILLFLRIALTKLLIIDFPWAPFALLSFACCVLVWQIHQSPLLRGQKKIASPVSPFKMPTMSQASSSADRIPLSSVGMSRSHDDLSLKLASWDTAIVEKLDAKTPLSTRFTDLSQPDSLQASPFSVPKSALTPARKPLLSPLASMRPSVLGASRCSGLEGELAGFSLTDTSPQNAISSPKTPLSSDQLFGASFFVMARILVSMKSEYIAGVLLMAVLFRGAVWNRLPSICRILINMMVMGRLVWLALSLRPGLFHLAIPEIQSKSLALAFDTIILLSR